MKLIGYRFHRTLRGAPRGKSAQFSLEDFTNKEKATGLLRSGRGLVSRMERNIQSTKRLDGTAADDAPATGRVMFESGLATKVRSGSPLVMNDKDLVFDPATGEAQSFDRSFSHTQDYGFGPVTHTSHQSYWKDDQGREHYGEQRGKTAYEVVIDRSAGTVAVLSGPISGLELHKNSNSGAKKAFTLEADPSKNLGSTWQPKFTNIRINLNDNFG